MAIKIMEVYVPETGLTHHINIDQIVDIAIFQTRTSIRLSTGDMLHTDISPAEVVEKIRFISNELPDQLGKDHHLPEGFQFVRIGKPEPGELFILDGNIYAAGETASLNIASNHKIHNMPALPLIIVTRI